MLFIERKVRIGAKTLSEVLSVWGWRPSTQLKTKGTVFASTDQPRACFSKVPPKKPVVKLQAIVLKSWSFNMFVM